MAENCRSKKNIKHVDLDEARKKRLTKDISIRKQKREFQQTKFRNLLDEDEASNNIPAQYDLQKALADLHSDDKFKIGEALATFRKSLSEKEPPIQTILDFSILPDLLSFLKSSENWQFQYEAAWIFTNLTVGKKDQTEEVVSSGIVPVIFKLLIPETNIHVLEQVIWTLGNIAGDCISMRNLLLSQNAVTFLLSLLEKTEGILSITQNIVWTIANLFRGIPQPPIDIMVSALPNLCRLTFSSDEDVLSDVCWALSYIDGDSEVIQQIIDLGIVRKVIQLMMSQKMKIKVPALRIIGNLATGNDVQTRTLLNCNLLPCLHSFLGGTKPELAKEACWILSNIAAGPTSHIDMLLQANFVPQLLAILNSSVFEVRREAAYASFNICLCGTYQQIAFLVGQGCLPIFCDLLSCHDQDLILADLNAIEAILSSGMEDGTSHFVGLLAAASGFSLIEQLMYNINPLISEKATLIFDRFSKCLDNE